MAIGAGYHLNFALARSVSGQWSDCSVISYILKAYGLTSVRSEFFLAYFSSGQQMMRACAVYGYLIPN